MTATGTSSQCVWQGEPLRIFLDGWLFSGRTSVIWWTLVRSTRTRQHLAMNPTQEWDIAWRTSEGRLVPLLIGYQYLRPAQFQFYDEVGGPLPAEARHELSLLRATDAIIFMARCSGAAGLNKEQLERLRRNLKLVERSPTEVPVVFALNLRDGVPSVPPEEVASDLPWPDAVYVPTNAGTGEGLTELIDLAIVAAQRGRARGTRQGGGTRASTPGVRSWGVEGSAQAATAIATVCGKRPVITAHGGAGASLTRTDGTTTAGLAAVQFEGAIVFYREGIAESSTSYSSVLHVDPVAEITTKYASVDAWLSATLVTPRSNVVTRLHTSHEPAGHGDESAVTLDAIEPAVARCRIFFDGWWASGRRTAIQWALMTATGAPHYMRTDQTEWDVVWRMGSGRLVPLVLCYEQARDADPVHELALLRGADAAVFMAVCSGVREQNPMQLERLRHNLALVGRTASEVPVVFALNLRDATPAIPPDEVRRDLSWPDAEYVETHASRGEGLQELIDLAITRAERALAVRDPS